MIVTCTSCKTRFRVSGQKIGPKGARIWCTRCKKAFAIYPEAPGGVLADPPDPPPWPDLEPPSLPGASARAAAADRGVPAKPEDPWSGGVGWDPFGTGEPAPRPTRDGPAPLPSLRRSTTDLTELLGERERALVDLGSLALEEHELAPPQALRRPQGGAKLDLGPSIPDLLPDLGSGGPEERWDAAAPDAFPLDREPPRLDTADLAAVSRASEEEPAATPAPRPPTAPAPAPGVESAPAPPPAVAAGSGRLAAALTNSFSLALLIAAAAVIFVGWKSGLATRLRGALTRGTPAPLVEASAVTGGLYDTAGGSPVLVVRGRVGARGAVTGPVRVRVELVDGARVVAAATGLAGAAATAEQVYGAGTPPEAAELRRMLDARAVSSLAAGASVPFLVVFPPPPPDPGGLRLRVEVEPAPATARTGG